MNNNWEEEFIEKGAALEHDRWAKWQKWMHGRVYDSSESINPHLKVIPTEDFNRWERQIATEYEQLSDKEKESDRIEVRKYLPLIKDLLTKKDQEHKAELEMIRQSFLETNIKELIEKMRSEIQEHGDMHGIDCACNMEDPDTCECTEMAFWGDEIEKYMGIVNHWWVVHAEAHREHCTPNGNKKLTKMMGKKNRESNSSILDSHINKLSTE
jgi:hypothetical protein